MRSWRDRLRAIMYSIGVGERTYSAELYKNTQEVSNVYKRTWHKKLALILLGALGLFVLVNVALWAIYYGRTYPLSRVYNANVGSVSFKKLGGIIEQTIIIPKTVRFTHNGRAINLTSKDLGLKLDAARTTEKPHYGRNWLPIANFINAPQLRAPFAVSSNALAHQTKKLGKTFNTPAQDAHLALNGSKVTIVDSVDGFQLANSRLQQSILDAFDRGINTVVAPGSAVIPKVHAADLQKQQQLFQGQLATKITYQYQDHGALVTPADIASWYNPSDNILSVSDVAIRAYILNVGKQIDIHIQNIDQAVISTKQALAANKDLSFNLTKRVPDRTFTYCTATRGVASTFLPTLGTLLHDTYEDERGWSLGGRVEFTQVATGCNYTVWLSTADQMASFGGVCDSDWSCRSGNNVVINFDRWQNASPAWNAAKGTLTEYRHMVINHETGHWLGFAHEFCGGPGQLAPVMQQQSINLQGCKFNAWPTPSELTTLQKRLGL